jgi:hypothetical protein
MNIKENKSLFLEYLGDTPQLRVMDFLIDNHFFDFPMTEISRGANVSYNSLKLFFPRLVQSNILLPTRKFGKSDYFQLNMEHPFIKRLIELDWSLIKNNPIKTTENKYLPN